MDDVKPMADRVWFDIVAHDGDLKAHITLDAYGLRCVVTDGPSVIHTGLTPRSMFLIAAQALLEECELHVDQQLLTDAARKHDVGLTEQLMAWPADSAKAVTARTTFGAREIVVKSCLDRAPSKITKGFQRNG